MSQFWKTGKQCVLIQNILITTFVTCMERFVFEVFIVQWVRILDSFRHFKFLVFISDTNVTFQLSWALYKIVRNCFVLFGVVCFVLCTLGILGYFFFYPRYVFWHVSVNSRKSRMGAVDAPAGDSTHHPTTIFVVSFVSAEQRATRVALKKELLSYSYFIVSIFNHFCHIYEVWNFYFLSRQTL